MSIDGAARALKGVSSDLRRLSRQVDRAVRELERIPPDPISIVRDELFSFFRDRCYHAPGSTISISFKDLFRAWVEFCKENGFEPGSRNKFSRDLYTICKVDRFRVNGQRCLRGLRLLRQDERPKYMQDAPPSSSELAKAAKEFERERELRRENA